LSVVFDMPAPSAACAPRPGGRVTALAFAHGAVLPDNVPKELTQAVVFDNGLVLLGAPRGDLIELRDPLGDLYARPVGTLQRPRGGQPGRLTFAAMTPHCAGLETAVSTLPEQDNRAARWTAQVSTYLAALDVALALERRAVTEETLAQIDAALATRIHSFGEDHVLTLRTRTQQLSVRRAVVKSRPDVRMPLREFEARLSAHDPRALATIDARRQAVGTRQFMDGDDAAVPLLQALYVETQSALGEQHDMTLLVAGQLASAYVNTNRFEEALALETRLLAHWTAVLGPNHRRSIEWARRVAQRTSTLGRERQAVEQFEDLLPRARSALGPDDDLTQRIVSQTAWALTRVNDFERALPLAQEFYEKRRARLPEGSIALAAAQVRYAESLWGSQRREEAVALFRSALAAYESAVGPGDIQTLDTRDQLANALYELRRIDEADAMYSKQIDYVERRYAASVLASDERVVDWSLWVPSYRRAAALAVELGDTERAFRLIEQAKGRQLLESVRARLARRVALPDPQARSRIEALEGAIAALDEESARAATATARIEIDARRQAASAALAEANRELEARFPDYARLRSPAPQTSAAVAKALPGGTVFVHLVIDEDDLLVLWVARGEPLRAARQRRVKHWQQHVQLLAEVLQSPELVPLRRSAAGLFSRNGEGTPATEAALIEAVSAPVVELLRAPLRQARAVVFSADGGLRRVPLEVLRLDGRALIERLEVSYALSGTLWLAARELARVNRAAVRPYSLLAVGGVDYSADDRSPSKQAGGPAIAAALASAESPSALAPTVVLRSARLRGERLKPLPASRDEVVAVAAVMQPNAQALLGAQATRGALLKLNAAGTLTGYRHVLLSAHGVLDLQYPALSAIVLGAERDDPAAGHVTAAEWMTFRFQSDLLVASACETALGGEGDGHGVGGLPLAFQLAGNPRTVLTLWRIDDATSARFVRRLYQELAAGRTPTAALRAVKLEFRKDSRVSRPFFWAPYVLFGASG
jgi:CHAT domain-containing protein